MLQNNDIAILMATYNSDRYVEEQLKSILSQTYPHWHLYIHDDGSADSTMEILSRYVEANPDRITILDYPSQGNAYANFMSLLSRVDSQLYMFADHDDVWHTDKVEKSYEAYRQQKAVTPDRPVIVHTDLCVVDADLHVINPSFWSMAGIHPEMFRTQGSRITNVVTGCTMLFDDAVKQCAIARTPYGSPLHDEWVTVCACAKGGVVVPVHEALIDYRQHGDNTLGAEVCCNTKNFAFYVSNVLSLFKENIENYKTLRSAGYGSYLKYIFYKIHNFMYYQLKYK
jgi:glycosyltransferase involved in cell wall biosynthesis